MTKPPSPTYAAALASLRALSALTSEVVRSSERLPPDERTEQLAFVEQTLALAASPPFRLSSLRQLERELLTPWQEGVGEDVERFWLAAGEAGLEVTRREDIVASTLERGRVQNMIQFVALDDAFEELQECGKIDAEQAERLDALLRAFESAPKNQKHFEGP